MPSQRGVRASNASSTAEVWTTLIEIDEPSLAEPIRVCDDAKSMTIDGHVYAPWPFEAQPPDDADEDGLVGRLVIDDIGQFDIPVDSDGTMRKVTTTQLLNSLLVAPVVTMTVVLASQPDVVEFGPLPLILRKATSANYEITGELHFEDVLDEPAMGDRFTPATHPGLF